MSKIWISCSEASGDMFAGALAGELLRQCPSLKITGMGGPALKNSGAKVIFSMNRLCFKGFMDVLLNLPATFRLHQEITQSWEEDFPEAIIMVDCPDFNLPLAKSAHDMGIPVYYFMAPQFWAWKQPGIQKLQRYVRKTFCALPFEDEYFNKRGCAAEYFGHPLLDIIPLSSLDKLTVNHNRIGFMPGSRRKEISFMLPEFAKTAAKLFCENPALEFHIARAPGISRDFLQQLWPSELPVTIVPPQGRFSMIKRSAFIFCTSGTATLETALIGSPTIVTYKLDQPAAFIAGKLAYSKFISLTNILFQEEIFPELLQGKANAEYLLTLARSWFNSADRLQSLRDKLRMTRTTAGPPGCLSRTANYILNDLNQ
ncbi:lipid-A-disaccharide synthase [Maridesulfovibrio sp.]|uniref:lipid-A-disaccharide synthase n=1 Tax=Maridesulfovibrio sp. TaxID=2795000 RepID=UPI0029C9C749|nr:lipid-A-disaccharide synthase [Maridesulfovibrio sp.]